MSAFPGALGTSSRTRTRSRLLAATVLLALALALAGALAQLLASGGGSPVPAVQSLVAQGRLPLPTAAPALAEPSGGDFAVRTGAAGSLWASNAPQQLSESFGASGVSVSSGAAHLGMRLTAVGYGGALRSVAGVKPAGQGDWVLFAHGTLGEWYANGPKGLEQGFTVAAPPAVHRAGPLTLAIALRGDLGAHLIEDGHGVAFAGPRGPVLLYTGLRASDARGSALASWLTVRGTTLLIHVDAQRARFPLRIDPFVRQAAFTGGLLGTAISASGNTAIIEAAGVPHVFTRTGTSWIEGEALTPAARYRALSDVALSGDGDTAIVRGLNASLEERQWVFVHSGGSWSQQAELAVSGAPTLSDEGDTALFVGGGLAEGEAYIYTRDGASWSKQAGPFKDPLSGEDFFGYSSALSANGNIALIGAPGDNGYRGAAFVFTRSGPTWSQTEKLTWAEEGGADFWGTGVALSGEGTVALVGDLDAENAVVFTRSGSSWSQLGKPFTAGKEGNFGDAVALSENGSTALVGDWNEGPEHTGSAFEFTRSGSTWTEDPPKLTGSGAFEEFFGENVYLSANAETALVRSRSGEVYVFVDTPTLSAASASEITTSTAQLASSVNPDGASVSSCRFEYGPTEAYGSSARCTPTPEGSKPVAVSASLKELAANTTYHFRLAVTSTAGTSYDTGSTFTTLTTIASATTKEPSVPATAKIGALTGTASSGTGTINVGEYGSDIGGPPLPGSTGGYADVYRSAGATFQNIELKDCEAGDARTAWWYDPAGGWSPVQPAASFSEGCARLTITEASSPSVAQLTGTRVKFGEPPGEYGECRASKDSVYSEGACLTVAEKKGVPDDKGKYEWYPVPVGCFPQKKGYFSEGTCSSWDEKKGKPTGKYEKGIDTFTGTIGEVKLEAKGITSIACTAGTSSGELLSPERGTQTLTLTGCSQQSSSCSSSEGSAGTIRTEPLEVITYEESGKYLLALTGSPAARFTCGSTSYTLAGAVSAPMSGAVNAMSSTSEAGFEPGTGQQQLTIAHGTTEYAATLTLTLSNTSAQPLELDSAIKQQ